MSASARVLCYGGISIDHIIHVPYLPTPGVAATPTAHYHQLGGGAAQTATWLAQWGIPVRLTGNAIGYDSHGDRVWRWLSAYPTLDLTHLARSDSVETPHIEAIVPPNGDRYLIEFGYDDAPMTPAEAKLLAGVAYVTVNFYLNNPERETFNIVRLAHEKGVRVVAADIIETTHELLPMTQVVINSAAVIDRQYPAVDKHQLMRELQAINNGIVILTNGADDVFVVAPDGSAFSVTPPHVEVHNATGAGDAFRAGLLYGLLHDWPLPSSVRLAAAAGALQVQRHAATERPATFETARSAMKTSVVREK